MWHSNFIISSMAEKLSSVDPMATPSDTQLTRLGLNIRLWLNIWNQGGCLCCSGLGILGPVRSGVSKVKFHSVHGVHVLYPMVLRKSHNARFWNIVLVFFWVVPPFSLYIFIGWTDISTIENMGARVIIQQIGYLPYMWLIWIWSLIFHAVTKHH